MLSLPPRLRDEYKDILDLHKELPHLTKLGVTYWFLKYDGIWAQVEINVIPGRFRIYSRTGQLKFDRYLTNEEAEFYGSEVHIFRGEYMFGQQWAQCPTRKGKVFLWECLVSRGSSLRHLPFSLRSVQSFYCMDATRASKECDLATLLTASNFDADYLVGTFTNLGFEGLVGVNPNSTSDPLFYRYKPDLEDDVIILGFTKGKGRHLGRLGAVTYGAYNSDGKLVPLGECGGGFSDEQRDHIWKNQSSYLNRVFTATSKLRFKSGALRSANFKCWRDDKPQTECLIKCPETPSEDNG